MVPPRGFLFLCFCGSCALKCEKCLVGVFFGWGKFRLVKQHLLPIDAQWRYLTLVDAIPFQRRLHEFMPQLFFEFNMYSFRKEW